MYQREGKAAYKADLSNTIKLTTYLRDPHLNFKTVHVGGTNGKGSTSYMLASVLQEAGLHLLTIIYPHRHQHIYHMDKAHYLEAIRIC